MPKTIHISLTVAAAILLLSTSCSKHKPPLQWADPLVGTGMHGHTGPSATAPFGMVQLGPDTRNNGWDGVSGYHDEDSSIIGFSHTHLSGTGQGDLGDFLFVPAIGDVNRDECGFKIEKMPFKKKDELARPGYYRVDFPDLGIGAEFTAGPRTGFHRYTFKGHGKRRLLVDMAYNIGSTRPDQITFDRTGNCAFGGGRHVSGWSPDRWIYFYAKTSVPFESCVDDGHNRYLLTFPENVQELTIAVGLSTVDVKGAQRNLDAETAGFNFDHAAARCTAAWSGKFSKIIVEGGTPTQKANFYSALYHCMVAPNLLSDVDGRFRNHYGEVVEAPAPRQFYSTFSLWDTFRTWHPLSTLFEEDLVSDIVYSLMYMHSSDGKLPLWALGGMDVDCMIGYHATAVIADAWLRGIRTFNGNEALQAMLVSSNSDVASDWYKEYGYIPCDLSAQSISKTLEFAYDDWCIAQMARSLGKEDIARTYDQRALSYRNIFDPATGFFRGRDSKGNFRAPFDPTGSSRDYTEATAWQYRFFAPHDIAGLRDLMGGPARMKEALDSLFAYDYVNPQMAEDGNVTGLLGQYAHGNEPSHASAFLYPWIGAPHETQLRVRQILEDYYSPTPEGLCGNEDCGQLSAWYVLAAVGLYPACPGSGEFIPVAPLFRKATLSLRSGKTLVVTADNPSHPYIKDIRLDGESLGTQFITFDRILQGGRLEFILSPVPCHDRDSLLEPYSMTVPSKPVVSPPYLTDDPRFFEGSFTATLLCRTDGAEIRYTLDGSSPTRESTLYEGPFVITGECLLQATAFKEGCQASPIMSAEAYPLVHIPAVVGLNTSSLNQGCRYTYHRGPFMWTKDVATSPVVSSGTMPSPSITEAPDADHFGYIFTGYLDVPEDGLWEFAVRSDDGSVLEIDSRLTVNNDGSHADYTATGHIALKKGLHAFRLLYLEDFEGQNLAWSWRTSPDKDFRPIPASAIFYK